MRTTLFLVALSISIGVLAAIEPQAPKAMVVAIEGGGPQVSRNGTRRPLAIGARLFDGDRISLASGKSRITLLELSTSNLVVFDAVKGRVYTVPDVLSGETESAWTRIVSTIRHALTWDDREERRAPGGVRDGQINLPARAVPVKDGRADLDFERAGRTGGDETYSTGAPRQANRYERKSLAARDMATRSVQGFADKPEERGPAAGRAAAPSIGGTMFTPSSAPRKSPRGMPSPVVVESGKGVRPRERHDAGRPSCLARKNKPTPPEPVPVPTVSYGTGNSPRPSRERRVLRPRSGHDKRRGLLTAMRILPMTARKSGQALPLAKVRFIVSVRQVGRDAPSTLSLTLRTVGPDGEGRMAVKKVSLRRPDGKALWEADLDLSAPGFEAGRFLECTVSSPAAKDRSGRVRHRAWFTLLPERYFRELRTRAALAGMERRHEIRQALLLALAEQLRELDAPWNAGRCYRLLKDSRRKRDERFDRFLVGRLKEMNVLIHSGPCGRR